MGGGGGTTGKILQAGRVHLIKMGLLHIWSLFKWGHFLDVLQFAECDYNVDGKGGIFWVWITFFIFRHLLTFPRDKNMYLIRFNITCKNLL